MTGRRFFKPLSGLRLRIRSLATLPRTQILTLVRKGLKNNAATLFAKLKRKIGLYLIRGIEKTSGSDRAHQMYWGLWPSVRGWSNTESRLNLLIKENPGAITKFVQIALEKNADPIVLMGLARNPHSRDALAECLHAETFSEGSPMVVRLKSSQQYAATLISVAGLLLDDTTAQRFAAQVMTCLGTLSGSFFQIIDSAGVRPAMPPSNLYLRGILDSGFRKPVAHRLIIIDDYRDAQAVAQLFVGARKVTVLALTDLFGSADFSPFVGLGGVEEIVVEHLRTRVSRFSAAYVENHEISRDVAQMIGATLVEYPGLLPADQRSYLEVAIADFLHFQCLKIAAVKTLLADPEFDHIVVGTGRHTPDSEYFRLLAGVSELATDPRVEVASIARTMGPKTQYRDCMVTMTTPPAPMALTAALETYIPLLLDNVDQRARTLAARLPSVQADHPPLIFMFTANNPAYNPSTARYAAALTATGQVEIIHAGLRTTPLLDELSALSEQAAGINITPLPIQFQEKSEAMKRWLLALVFNVLATQPKNAATHILRINAERIVSEVIDPQLVLLHALEAWFSRLKQAKTLPDIVILSPNRAPQVGAISPVARRYGVPTLTLEAHGLNANYSRYLKVTSDYYGVVSEYFRREAEIGFDIPHDRIAVIGTPRIIAPKTHNPQTARTIARNRLGQEQGIIFETQRGTISFFCQPSAWEHVVLVWRSILLAAKSLGLGVLLKPHPEETPTRVAAYLALVRDMGMAGQVRLVTGAPTPIIEASDVVLTAYSAAALDAAVLQVPVICVTEGNVEYPVDQHAIIDAPLVHSTLELQACLADILAAPAAAQARAAQFLAREQQFIDGPDDRLRDFVAEILAKPASEKLRPAATVPSSVFLDSPHPIFPV